MPYRLYLGNKRVTAPSGTLASTVAGPSAAFTGSQTITGTFASIVAGPSSAFTASERFTGTFAGTVAGPYMSGASAPTVRVSGSVSSSTGAISSGLPAGTVAGDLLLYFIETEQGASAPTASGWTQLLSIETAADATGTRLTVLWKISNGADATTTNDPGDHAIGRIVGITTGTFDPTDPFGAGSVVTAVDDVADTSATIPGITTRMPNALVIAAIANGDDPGANGTANYTFTNAGLTSVSERADNVRTDGNGGGIGVISGVRAGAGVVPDTTATLAVASFKAMAHIAIAPVSSFFTGAETFTGTLAGTVAGPSSAFAASEAITGALASSVAPASGAFTASESIPGTFDATAPPPSASFSGALTITGTMAVTAPQPDAALDGFMIQNATGEFALTVPSPFALLEGPPFDWERQLGYVTVSDAPSGSITLDDEPQGSITLEPELAGVVS